MAHKLYNLFNRKATPQFAPIPGSTQVPLTTVTQSVPWAPRALAGFTWTGANQLTVMAEYYYDGAGFSGDDYRRLISYSQALRGAPGAGPDLLDQFGTFSTGQRLAMLKSGVSIATTQSSTSSPPMVRPWSA